MIRNLTRETKTIRLRPDGSGFTVAAGVTTPLNGDAVDTAGWDGVRFMTGFGAIVSGGVQSCKVQQGEQANLSDAVDLAGSSRAVGDTDDNKVAVIEIVRPAERYLRCVTLRATQNATIDFQVAELFRTRDEPVTQDSSIVGATHVFLLTPAEGTP